MMNNNWSGRYLLQQNEYVLSDLFSRNGKNIIERVIARKPDRGSDTEAENFDILITTKTKTNNNNNNIIFLKNVYYIYFNKYIINDNNNYNNNVLIIYTHITIYCNDCAPKRRNTYYISSALKSRK